MLDFSLGQQDCHNLVVERQEASIGPVAPITMNAFELISTSQGLNLGSLFEKKMVYLTIIDLSFFVSTTF